MKRNNLIFFISDSTFFASREIEILVKNGFKVITFEDPDVLMEAFDGTTKPALIITGSALPLGEKFARVCMFTTETGFALYKWIRSQDNELPVILYTSSWRDLEEIRRIKDTFACGINKTEGRNPNDLLRTVLSFLTSPTLA